MLKTDLHGRLRSYPNWTHFDDVKALSNPFVVRMTHIILSYNDTGIFGMSVTTEDRYATARQTWGRRAGHRLGLDIHWARRDEHG